MSGNDSGKILRAGHNCWRIERASRVAVAIDGECYFRALREAILGARERVIILGWDIHSQLQLVRDGEDDGFPCGLGALLDFVARERQVDVYVLSWDFAMIYALERETFPLYSLNWKTHSRVRFHLDAAHPTGASQHQKIAVIDDALGFCGGLDLSVWRWDTSEHAAEDERRVDPDGHSYPPFHDLQMAVDGDAAAALAELARERWQRATGHKLEPLQAGQRHCPWSDCLAPVMQNVGVAIARTQPEYEGRSGVREVEQLYLDSIAAAQRYIYIENQYLTSHAVAEALAERLRDSDGPEVVVIMPQKTGGWLEQQTMDVVRGRVVRQLADADGNDRLRLYYPRVSVADDVTTMVHAKLMIADDRWLRLGSANLSNRSMALDSECDMAVEADPCSDEARAIRDLLAALLAQHLGRESGEVSEALEREPSLIRAIESLRKDGERGLQSLDAAIDPSVDELVPDSALIDPERPMDAEHFVSHFVPDEYRPHSTRRVLVGAATLVAALGLAAAWRWTPLGELLDVGQLTEQARALNAHAATPLAVIVLFGLAGTLAVPLTLLVIASVLAFGPLAGFAYSLAGAELSALISYVIGRNVGRDLVRRHAGKTLNAVSKRLSRSGIAAIFTLRVVPVAPFAIINLVAGASHISLRDFAIGTLLGLLPGLTAIALFADGLSRALQEPDLSSIAWVVGLLALIAISALWLRRLLKRRQRSTNDQTPSG
ncbi:MAG: VTT domain-containing protein [Pseudomonadales bacterium]|nr:VTT domain-containing protein [Pseudomonadales bacterium]